MSVVQVFAAEMMSTVSKSNSMRIILICVLLLFIGFANFGCSLSHSNPIDPQSPNYHPPAAFAKSDFVARVYSLHTLRTFPPAESYSVKAEAWPVRLIALDTVLVSYHYGPEQGLWRSIEDVWKAGFEDSYFGNPRLGSVIGQPFVFTFQGMYGASCVSDPVYVFRVITDSPRLIHPIDNTITNPFPNLEWFAFESDFPFESVAEVIYRNYNTAIWTSNHMTSSVTQISIADSLPNGAYYWTLSVIDPFENTSKSREGYFTVEADTL